MKKTLITAVAVLATLNMYGQGTVVFSNSGGAPVINSRTGVNVVAGSTFKVGLYYGAVGATESEFAMLGASANIFPTAGFFSAGNRTAPIAAAGGNGQFQVRAWESAFGTDYAQVLGTGNPGALVGKSNIMLVDTGDPTSTPAGAPTPIAPLMQGFSLTPVPEPSVIGLGLLGAVSLLMLRRRK